MELLVGSRFCCYIEQERTKNRRPQPYSSWRMVEMKLFFLQKETLSNLCTSTAMGKEFPKLPIPVQVLRPCKQHLCWEETVWLCCDRPHWIDHKKFFFARKLFCLCHLHPESNSLGLACWVFPTFFRGASYIDQNDKEHKFRRDKLFGTRFFKMLGMCIDQLSTCDSEVGWAIWAVQDDILGTDRHH